MCTFGSPIWIWLSVQSSHPCNDNMVDGLHVYVVSKKNTNGNPEISQKCYFKGVHDNIP